MGPLYEIGIVDVGRNKEGLFASYFILEQTFQYPHIKKHSPKSSSASNCLFLKNNKTCHQYNRMFYADRRELSEEEIRTLR
jgi:hypothetical protein